MKETSRHCIYNYTSIEYKFFLFNYKLLFGYYYITKKMIIGTKKKTKQTNIINIDVFNNDIQDIINIFCLIDEG
jgi:predicted transporter